MKYTVAILAAIAATVNAQAQCEAAAESIPPCALGYIASAASAQFSCGIVDFACQCSNSAALAATLVQPLNSAGCALNDVLAGVSAVCACVSSNSGQPSLTATPSSCASQAASIPACALGYLASAGKAVGQCSLQDFGCQCSNFQAIEGSVAQAVGSACSGGINDVLNSASALCQCAGGSSGSSSGGSSGSASSAPASATSAGSSKATGSGSTPAATGGSGSSAPKATSSAKASGAGGSGSGSGPSVFTGAAAPAAIGGGFLAFIGGLVAML